VRSLRDLRKRSVVALGVGASLSSQMKIYISSTYQDLSDHRSAVDRTLRRMGHDVIGMERARSAKSVLNSLRG
jgi:hypothetical protein